VLLIGLTGVSPLWDLPQVSCLISASLGCVGAGQFLEVLEVFWLALCRVLPCRLCFGGVFVPEPREITEALWNICGAAAVATGLTSSVHGSDLCHRSGTGHRSDRCSTGSKPCKFPLCVLVSFGSEGCSLVPRISSTPVAMWS
jgi:hypothetical protein